MRSKSLNSDKMLPASPIRFRITRVNSVISSDVDQIDDNLTVISPDRISKV